MIIQFINMSEENNIVDKVTDDSTKIVMTTRSVKWVIGILSTAVITILTFAWGLYIKIDAKVDTQYDELNKNMTKNKTEIILDCQALSYLDSEGLELLVRMHEDLQRRGGGLTIVSLNDVCLDILLATRLINILQVRADIHEAIRSKS